MHNDSTSPKLGVDVAGAIIVHSLPSSSRDVSAEDHPRAVYCQALYFGALARTLPPLPIHHPLVFSKKLPRITEAERSLIISLVGTDPPGRSVRGAGGELEAIDEQKEAHWTLDALTAAARERGITVRRSQVRRILKAEGVRWRNARSWAESEDPEFAPKGRG